MADVSAVRAYLTTYFNYVRKLPRPIHLVASAYLVKITECADGVVVAAFPAEGSTDGFEFATDAETVVKVLRNFPLLKEGNQIRADIEKLGDGGAVIFANPDPAAQGWHVLLAAALDYRWPESDALKQARKAVG